MQLSYNKEARSIRGLFLFIYFSLGALYPLLSHYLKGIGMNGTQIGLIVSIGPIVALIAQPIWGLASDRTHRPREILGALLLLSLISSLFLVNAGSFYPFLLLYALLHFFLSGAVPLTDGMALGYMKRMGTDFGKIRQWGAIGFAVATFVVGAVAEQWGTGIIFYVFALSQLVGFLFLRNLRNDKRETSPSLRKGVMGLIRMPRFLLFLLSAFLIFGPMNSHNIYFGLLFEQMGGDLKGVGLAFLLFAGSEAPVMKFSGVITRKMGLENTILLAGLISSMRWFWYSTSPTPTLVLTLFFIQGLSVGLYLSCAAQYVRENTPDSLRMTALSLYASMGLGLGSMASNLVGGIVYDRMGILATYRLFSLFTLCGLIPLVIIIFLQRHKNRSSVVE